MGREKMDRILDLISDDDLLELWKHAKKTGEMVMAIAEERKIKLPSWDKSEPLRNNRR